MRLSDPGCQRFPQRPDVGQNKDGFLHFKCKNQHFFFEYFLEYDMITYERK